MTTDDFEDPLVARAAEMFERRERTVGRRFPAIDPCRCVRSGDLIILGDTSGTALAMFRIRRGGNGLKRLRLPGTTRLDDIKE